MELHTKVIKKIKNKKINTKQVGAVEKIEQDWDHVIESFLI